MPDSVSRSGVAEVTTVLSRDRAELELDVDARRLADLHFDRLDDRGLEAVERDGHAIDAGVERRDDVVAALVRGDGHRQVGRGVGDDHRGLRDRRMRRGPCTVPTMRPALSWADAAAG